MSPCFGPNITLVDQPIFNLPVYVNWIIIVVCLFVCGLFSASENAFSSCNKYHFSVLADRGEHRGKAISFLIDNFDSTLITVLIANNGIQFFMSYLASDAFLQMMGDGSQYSLVATLVMSLLVYIFTDTLFKVISRKIPNKLVNFLVYIDIFFYFLLWPVTQLFKLLTALIHKIFKIKDKNILTKEDFLTEADKAINEESGGEEEQKEELLEPDEMKILNRAFYFDSIPVSNVLTKKEVMFALDITDLTAEKVNKIILSTSYSRIPVYDEVIDNIIGVLTIKTYFKEFMSDEHVDIRSVLTKPLFVKKDQKVDEIFESFNRTKTHIAFVMDENDKLVGMVTMDDVLNELVGDLDEDKINKLRENKYASK